MFAYEPDPADYWNWYCDRLDREEQEYRRNHDFCAECDEEIEGNDYWSDEGLCRDCYIRKYSGTNCRHLLIPSSTLWNLLSYYKDNKHKYLLWYGEGFDKHFNEGHSLSDLETLFLSEDEECKRDCLSQYLEDLQYAEYGTDSYELFDEYLSLCYEAYGDYLAEQEKSKKKLKKAKCL